MPPRKTDKWEAQHQRNLLAYERQIDAIYKAAVAESASIAGLCDFSPVEPFSFSKYPITQERVRKLLYGLGNDLYSAIVNGVRSEWTLANRKNDELCNVVFGDMASLLTDEQRKRYYATNPKAQEAFLARKESGLNLSDRVWKYTDQFKEEIEMGIDIGLRDGLSADELSRDLRQYLQYPDKLFRRVRDEHGILQLSKAAKAFHPGQGVYRSSYKNARRLAATEANIAFRTADYERWQQLDFVVGFEVKLSKNHPVTDICDYLKGRYPKDFKFTGWHPHCRCYVVSILKTPEEMQADNELILQGGEPSEGSVNTVTDVPQGFKDWLKDNEERAKRSTSMPYFIKDNPQYLPKVYQNLYGMKTPYADYAEYEKAMRYNRKHGGFSKEQQANIRELNEALPVLQGKIMNFSEADQGRANPNFSMTDASELGYKHNCQTCTMAYELRRRGFCVEAVPNPVVSGYKNYREFSKYCRKEGVEWTDRFLNADGTPATYSWSGGIKDTGLAKLKFIDTATAEQGRYEVYCAWKGGSAHVWIMERQKDGELLWFDPQSGRRGGLFDDFVTSAKPDKIGVMRIDDKLVNPKFAKRLLKASE